MLTAAAAAILTAQSGFSTHRAAAEALLRQGKAAAALPFLEKARAADPSHYVNNWDLSLAYLRTGKLDLARLLLASLIERNGGAGHIGELRNLLAEVEEARGNAEEAARQYQEAAHAVPNEKHIADWARHLIKCRAFDSALKVYASGVEMHPRSVALRLGLGTAYYSTGEYESAARTLCAAVDLDPADLRPLEFLGKAIGIAPSQDAEVAKRLAGYAARYPRNARARLYHALSLDADPVAQERELRAALALDTRLAEAHLQLGVLAEQQGRDSPAIAALVRAVALKPDLEAAHFRLGRLYREQGDAARADRHVAEYRRLRAARPAGDQARGLRVE